MNKVIKGCVFTSVGVIGSFTVILFYNYWRRDRGKWCKCLNRVRGKVAVVTGANSGIGYQVALDLANKGATVYLGCRDDKKGKLTASQIKKKSGNPHIYYCHLDLTDFSSCKLFSFKIHRAEERLDYLFNVAGVFHLPASLTTDGFDVTIQTNFLGVIALTDCLLGLLEVNRNSRVIFVNSESHRMVHPNNLSDFDPRMIGPPRVEFWDHVHHYALTKQALKLYANCLTIDRPTLKIISVNPGNVWTNIYRKTWQNWWQLPTRFLCSLFMRSTGEGAQSIIHAANVPGITSGSYISDCKEDTTIQIEHTEIARHLTKRSRSLIPSTVF